MSAGYQLLWSLVKENKPSVFSDMPKDLFHIERTSDRPSELELYNFIQRHKSSYRQLPDPESLRTNGFPYEDTKEPTSYYFERVKTRNLRSKTLGIQKFISKILKDNTDYDKVIPTFSKFVNDLNKETVSNKVKTLREIAEEYLEEVELSKLQKLRKTIPFGWPSLDKVTGGGMFGGDVIYMVARPGQGKSSLIGACSYQGYINGAKTLTFSMEMMDKAFASRVIAQASGFNPNALRMMNPDFHTEEKLRNFIRNTKKECDYYIAEGAFRQTTDSIRTLVEKIKPDVVYIDASYLVSPSSSSKVKWERLSEVGEHLKQIALDYDIPIFQTVQFNREAGKKSEFSLENIAGGDFIGQLGSVVIAIQAGEGIHEETRRKISVIKNRDGDQCEFDINFSFNPPNFKQVTEEELDNDEQLYDTEFPL
jgi:replicative DNA helicase